MKEGAFPDRCLDHLSLSTVASRLLVGQDPVGQVAGRQRASPPHPFLDVATFLSPLSVY